MIASRNRRQSLVRTLLHLEAIPDGPQIVVVDNGSDDGSATVVRERFDQLHVVALKRNHGAAARNDGVAALGAEVRYIAFADDDSWWTPGSLQRAVQLLEAHPGVGGIIARVELSDGRGTDAVSHKLAAALLGREPDLPGPRALSFPAFSAVLRRSAFEAVGGFSPFLFFGGEEQLLAIDLAMAGHPLCYRDDVVAVHAPANAELTPQRWALQTRNDVLVTWLRRPLPLALAATVRLARSAPRNAAARSALRGVGARLPAAWRMRRPVSAELERELRITEAPFAG